MRRTNGATPMPAHKTVKLAEPAQAAEIPSVDRLLNARALQPLLAQHGRTRLTGVLRRHLAELRRAALAAGLERATLGDEAIAAAAEASLAGAARPALRPVFNLTGTVLHTNLGRALLPDEAVRAVVPRTDRTGQSGIRSAVRAARRARYCWSSSCCAN